GHWRGVRAEGVEPNAQTAANTFATGSEIIARGNQIMVSTPRGPGQQATYFVDREYKKTLVIHTDRDGVKNKETFSCGADGKTMTWRMGSGRTIAFNKAN